MFVGVLGIRKFDEEIRKKKKTFVKYFNYALLWPRSIIQKNLCDLEFEDSS